MWPSSSDTEASAYWIKRANSRGLACALPSTMFVGHRSAHELVTKHCAPGSAHAGSYSMRINRDLLRHLPYAKFSEVSHAKFFITGDREVPSFSRTEPPDAASAHNGKRETGNGKQETGNG
jgi:hypothetical protein